MKTKEHKKIKWSVSIALGLLILIGAIVGALINKDKENNLIINVPRETL